MLQDHFDGVVMLTWSDWKTEPRSNRYHYASRFALSLPVLFVQPDLAEARYRFEPTELSGVAILHVPRDGPWHRQGALLTEALAARGIRRPLLWAYNVYLQQFARSCLAPLKIYHATEEYFKPSVVVHGLPEDFRPMLRHLVLGMDLLVACSDGVLGSYVKHTGFHGQTLVLPNGCDYAFYAPSPQQLPDLLRARRTKVALYQGGINRRVDFPLLAEVIRRLPDWEFWVCGATVDDVEEAWGPIRNLPNTVYHGRVSVERLRELSHQATVGLIPFVQDDYITKSSLPLKAFEYVACGLPVVTVPIEALKPYPDCFAFACTAEQFAAQIQAVGSDRCDRTKFERRLRVAAEQSYDKRFTELCAKIDSMLGPGEATAGGGDPLNVLVLYDDRSLHVNTISEHLNAFSRHSRHRVHYAIGTGQVSGRNVLPLFDAVLIHYSIRVCLADHLAAGWRKALREFPGLKVLFIQDEYDTTETSRRFMEECGIQVVYTCVPPPYREEVYPRARFPHVEFVDTLTGWVPEWCYGHLPVKPLAQRRHVLGYRGRPLPFWYGALGQEKVEIGRRMRAICEAKGVPCDIGWGDQDRLYGPAWYDFLQDCRAVLGTESGSNVFDFTGSIRRDIEAALQADPQLSFAAAFDRYLAPHEGKVRMNQVSPRVFEAIGSRTGLVLFEGEYSGVIRPDVHFIPLKKDFSNTDEVFAKLADDGYMSTMIDRAYRDVISTGRYAHRQFVQGVDQVLSRHVRRGLGLTLIRTLSAYLDPAGRGHLVEPNPGDALLRPSDRPLPAAWRSAPVAPASAAAPEAAVVERVSLWRRAGRRLPGFIKQPLKAILR